MADALANSTNAAPVSALRQVSKHFGRFAALKKITAEFPAGLLYVILGENGAGKSTLLRMLAGLVQPTHGQVELLGHGDGDFQSVQKRFGYMAHPSLLYDEMSALENLIYFARLYGLRGVSAANRCREVICAVGLDPELRRPVGQYSQGMRQRASLARAIVHDPELLLLDEPFSNVDVASAQAMVGLLSQMRDLGKTIFVVTHQLPLLAAAGDEFIWMSAGEIVARTAIPIPPSAAFGSEVQI